MSFYRLARAPRRRKVAQGDVGDSGGGAGVGVDVIVNTHDQLVAAGGGVAIVTSRGGARADYIDGVLVYRVVDGRAVATDKSAAWYHHGRKWFSSLRQGLPWRQALDAAATEAKAWVRERGWYDGAWVRNRQRDLVPAEINLKFPIERR